MPSSTSKSTSQLNFPRSHASMRASRIRLRHRLAEKEEIGKQRFLAFLVLGRTDDGVEEAGIVVEIAEVEIVGDVELVAQCLALIFQPLMRDEAAESQKAAHHRDRLLEQVFVVVAGGAKANARRAPQGR